MLTQAPKGTRDMLPQDAYIWQAIEAVMRRRAALAGFREVRTPVFEHTAFPSRRGRYHGYCAEGNVHLQG